MGSESSQSESAVRTAAQFATTHWSVVLAAVDSASPDSKEALERLCRTYWYPLYAFVRRTGNGVEDSEDLTQEFLLRIIEKHRLRHADPNRGRFRTFLLSALKHFLCDEWDHRKAVRRGGGMELLPLDVVTAERRYRAEPAAESGPDVLFERNWATSLLESVLTRLEAESRAAGKEALFDALAPCLMGDSLDKGYGAVGQRLELTEAAVKMAVLRLRQRFRRLLRLEIEQTVTSAEEADLEFQYLTSVLRGRG